MNCYQFMVLVFRSILLIATAILLVFCIRKYIQNHSTTSTEYRTYHQRAQDIYPSINFCFSGLEIYDEEKMKQLYGIDNVTEYPMYLKGEKWNEKMMNVDYDEVTGRLQKLFNSVDVSFDVLGYHQAYHWVNKADERNRAFMSLENANSSEKAFPFFIPQRTAEAKCFGFHFSSKVVDKVKGKFIRRFILSLNTTESQNISSDIYLNYPGQFVKAIPLGFEIDKKKDILSGNLDLQIVNLGVIEVIRRRESSKESCNPDSERTDELWYKKMADDLNCKPSHWKHIDYPNICNDTVSMKRTNLMERYFIDPDVINIIDLPCDELQDVDFKTFKYSRGTFDEDVLKLLNLNHQSAALIITFDRSIYREITHFRGYNLEGLVGNGGGYVGLFLGFAVWQIPDFINLAHRFIDSRMHP